MKLRLIAAAFFLAFASSANAVDLTGPPSTLNGTITGTYTLGGTPTIVGPLAFGALGSLTSPVMTGPLSMGGTGDQDMVMQPHQCGNFYTQSPGGIGSGFAVLPPHNCTPVTLAGATIDNGSGGAGTTLTVASSSGLAAGQFLSGTGVTAGTYLVSQTDGTHWVVSTSQLVPATAITTSVTGKAQLHIRPGQTNTTEGSLSMATSDSSYVTFEGGIDAVGAHGMSGNALTLTNALTGSTAGASLTGALTWNTSGVVYGSDIQITNTASGTGSLVERMRVGSTVVRSLDISGNETVNGNVISTGGQFQSNSTIRMKSLGGGDQNFSANNIQAFGNILLVSVADAQTAPTIASGGCTTGAAQSVSSSNGTAAFEITLGGATCGSTLTLTLPAATTHWHCTADDVTTPASNEVHQTAAASTTSVVLTNFVRTTGVAGNFTGADHLLVSCRGQ